MENMRRLTSTAGYSTQRTLPFGTVEDVQAETQRLLKMGRPGGYIFAPAHDVKGMCPGDMLLLSNWFRTQPGYREHKKN